MNILTKEEVKALMGRHSDVCISMFLPALKGGGEIQQRRFNLLNQLKETQHRLLVEHPLAVEHGKLLKPVYALLDDEQSWQAIGDSLAMFCAHDEFHCYRIPFDCKSQVILTDHFYLKPLLPLFVADQRFYLLALSQNDLRLFECTHFRITEMALPDTVPQDLAHVQTHEEPDNQVQFRSSSSGASRGTGGRRAVIFYGQGVGIDDAKENILRYFQQIDRGLHEILHDEQAPLIIAGVEYLLPIYREANTYPHLIEQGGILGNPDKLSAHTLLEHAWPLVEPYVLRAQHEVLNHYEAWAQTELASANSSEIVLAAFYGRVADLFVALDQEQWGTFDPTTYAIQIHEERESGDDDLLDLAATQSILHGGRVYAMERENMPDKALLAAVFRF